MNNNPSLDIAKKEIEKAIVSELCNKGLIDFTNTSNIVGKLDEDISKLKKLQENNKDNENIIVKIPV